MLGDYYGKVDNVNDALKAYKKQAQDFIDYTISMNAAIEYANKAGEQSLRLRKAQDTLKLFPKEDIDAVKNNLENIKKQYQNYYIDRDKRNKNSELTEIEKLESIKKANIKFFEDLKKFDFSVDDLFAKSSSVNIDAIFEITKNVKELDNIKGSKRIAQEVATISSATIQMNANRKTSIELLKELISEEDKGRKGREKNEKTIRSRDLRI